MAFICEPTETRADTLPGALHTLNATPRTVHWGYFDPARGPAIRNAGRFRKPRAG